MPARDDKKRGGGLAINKKDEHEVEEKGTDGKKQEGNTTKTKSARKDSKAAENEKENLKSIHDVSNNAEQSCCHNWDDDEHIENGQKAYQEFKKQNQKNEAASAGTPNNSGSAHSDDQEHPTPKKRGRGANAAAPNKKSKSGGSSDKPNGVAGDKTRVPKVGQKVQWKALPGYVDGEVVEIVYEEKSIEGKAVKASKEDPRIVLKSSSSGKIAVHKPEAVYFS